jgi:hypothetical protein
MIYGEPYELQIKSVIKYTFLKAIKLVRDLNATDTRGQFYTMPDVTYV